MHTHVHAYVTSKQGLMVEVTERKSRLINDGKSKSTQTTAANRSTFARVPTATPPPPAPQPKIKKTQEKKINIKPLIYDTYLSTGIAADA